MSEYKEVIHLDKAYVLMDERTVLRDIHVVMNQGEFCYLRGDTGSGKSTFIKGLFGLLKMGGARIYSAGFDLSELNHNTLPEYRRKLGLISDIYPLMTEQSVQKNLDTIMQVTGTAIASEREKRISEVLSLLEITAIQGEIIEDLPSGMRQKVAIARAVLNKPKLLLADNPMIHLDSKSIEAVMQVFIGLVRENQTAVLCAIPDDYLSTKYPARTYMCGDGTITESR